MKRLTLTAASLFLLVGLVGWQISQSATPVPTPPPVCSLFLTRAAWSPDDHTFALLMNDRIALYDRRTPEAAPRLIAIDTALHPTLRFDPGGRWLYSENTLYEVATLEVRWASTSGVQPREFTPSGRFMREDYSTIRSVESGEVILTADTLRMSPFADVALAMYYDGGVTRGELWDLNDVAAGPRQIAPEYGYDRFTTDNRWLLLYGTESPIEVWEIATGRLAATLEHTYGQQGMIAEIGSYLLTTSFDGAAPENARDLILWDMNTWAPVTRLDAVAHIGHSADGGFILVRFLPGSTDGQPGSLGVLDIDTGTLQPLATEIAPDLMHLDFAAAGGTVALVMSGRALIWSFEALRRSEPASAVLTLPEVVRIDAELSPDGARLKTTYYDADDLHPTFGTVYGVSASVWDVTTGQTLIDVAANGLSLRFTPDGRWVMYTDLRGDTTQVFDAATGVLLHSIPGEIIARSADWMHGVYHNRESRTVALFDLITNQQWPLLAGERVC